ncbi:hypothetical protein F4779DRAFT_576337 [Xylariaceae sp. FL0662B]|nr:hypothetical protein F4779DRAFT_576337 [Xylariaceae sp. FL0662B]
MAYGVAATGEQSFGRIAALTTIFDHVCSDSWLLTTTKAPSQYPPFPTAGPASCEPPSWHENIDQKGFGYYSPAICPVGFTVGCTIRSMRIGEGFPPIVEGETAMYCVPNGFTCTSDTTDFRGGIWGLETAAVNTAAHVVVGPAIQIRWREDDLRILATDPLTPGVLPTPANDIDISKTVLAITYVVEPTSSIQSGHHENQSRPFAGIPTGMPTVSFLSPSLVDTMTRAGATPSAKNGDVSTTTSNGHDDSNIASGTSVAAMAMSGMLILLTLGCFAFAALRRYRRYHAGQIYRCFPIACDFRGVMWWRKRHVWQRKEPIRRTGDPDAELGTDGPIPELGPGNPLGTNENPAELIGNDKRKSWMSRVSRIFTTRLRKEVWSV